MYMPKYLRQNFKDLFVLDVHGCFPACMSVHHKYAGLSEVKGQHWIPRNWSYRWLWATMFILGIEPRSFGRSVSDLTHLTFSLVPIRQIFYKVILIIGYICYDFLSWLYVQLMTNKLVLYLISAFQCTIWKKTKLMGDQMVSYSSGSLLFLCYVLSFRERTVTASSLLKKLFHSAKHYLEHFTHMN